MQEKISYAEEKTKLLHNKRNLISIYHILIKVLSDLMTKDENCYDSK